MDQSSRDDTLAGFGPPPVTPRGRRLIYFEDHFAAHIPQAGHLIPSTRRPGWCLWFCGLGGSWVIRGLAVLAGCALLAGCGGSSSSGPRARASRAPATAFGEPLAERVCGGARQAAAKALGSPLSARIVRPAAASLECVLTGHQVRVTIDSQAGPRAYTEFDTEIAHQEQVFGPGIHEPGQIPTPITVPGSTVAVWIPARVMLVATNATPTTGGAYVTVAVGGHAAPGKVALRVATTAAVAAFAAHPNGPSLSMSPPLRPCAWTESAGVDHAQFA